MQVVWSFLARRQLDSLVMYIAQEDSVAAVYIDELLCDAAESLQRFPRKGRLGRVDGTRELVTHPNYILVYTIDGASINITAVLHSAQQYPPE